MAKSKEPWQRGPTELIEQALFHLHRQTDVDRRIAFLLLDVGVETMFKTFLTLPDKVTGTKISHPERKKAAESYFHELVYGIEKAAAGRLPGIKLERVQYYHNIRNKLYHDGSGITISPEMVNGYAELAVKLLRLLLNANLVPVLRKPEKDARRKAVLEKVKGIKQKQLNEQAAKVQEARARLAQLVRLATEKIEPGLVLPSFEQRFSILPRAALGVEGHSDELKALMKSISSDGALLERIHPLEISGGDITIFYLILLQRTIVNANDNGIWYVDYILSKDYPQSAQEIHEYPYKDPESPTGYSVDIYEPTHAEIMDKGKEWQKHLEDACTEIEKWLNAQSTVV